MVYVKSDAPTNFVAEVSTGVTNVDEPRSDEERERERERERGRERERKRVLLRRTYKTELEFLFS